MEDFELNDGEIIKPKRPAPKTAWVKGQSGNPSGRPKGTKNKSTMEIKELMQKIMSMQLDNLDGDLDKMSDFNRWLILDKLAKYFIPSLTKAEVYGEINRPVKIEVVYKDKKRAVESED